MITVHHLENSRSQRILWLLEELGLDYHIVPYRRDRATGLAPPALLAVHPLGKSPVITDGDATVAESGAIIEYLVGRYDDGRLAPPAGTPERLAYTYWLHYAEGSFMPLMVLSLILRRIESARMPFLVRPVARGIVAKVRNGYLDPNVERNLDFMESSLAGGDWFCGTRFTAADIQMSFAVEAAAVRSEFGHRRPRLAAFRDRIHARPAYRTALDRGGPFQLLG
jgi:glutathione S-transferase